MPVSSQSPSPLHHKKMTVRYFVEQHESQLQRPPLVRTVAELVKEVGVHVCATNPCPAEGLWNAPRRPAGLAETGPAPLKHPLHPPCTGQMNYRYKHLVAAMLVAGWDEQEGAQVYGCPIGGTLARERWATDGSGSTYIWGYLDSEYRCGSRGCGAVCASRRARQRRTPG